MSADANNFSHNLAASFPFKYRAARVMSRVGSPFAGYVLANFVQENTGDMHSNIMVNVACAVGNAAIVNLGLNRDLKELKEQE